MPLNDYHSILLDIAQDNPGGGVDLRKELARRFMEAGGVSGLPGEMPTDPFQGPVRSYTETPAQTTARDASIRQQTGQPMSGEPGAQPVPGSYDQEHPDSQAATYDQGQRLAREQPAAQALNQPPGAEAGGFPSVPPPPKPSEPAATPAAHGGGGQPSQMQQYLKEGNQSIRDEAAVAGQQGRATADLQANAVRQMQGAVEDSQRYASQLDAQKQHALQRQMALIEASAGTIDPKKYWGSLDGSHRALASISMVLGAIGGGLQGQGNTSPIVGQIQQNIAMQKDQFERDSKAANAYGDIYKNLTADGLSHAQATEAATKMMEAISAKQVEATAAKFAGPVARAAIGQHLAEFGLDSGKKSAETQASLSQAWNTNNEAKTKAFQLDQMKKLAAMYGPGMGPGNLVRDENGETVGVAPTSEAANKAAEIMSKHGPAIAAVDRLVKWRDANGHIFTAGGAIPNAKVREGEQMAAEARRALQVDEGFNRLSPEVQKETFKEIPSDPNGWINPLPQMRSTLAGLKNERDSAVAPYVYRSTQQKVGDKTRY